MYSQMNNTSGEYEGFGGDIKFGEVGGKLGMTMIKYGEGVVVLVPIPAV